MFYAGRHIYSSHCNALELWNLLHSCLMLAGIYSSHCNALELWNLLVLMFYAGRYILQSLQCIGTLEPSATHVLCWQVYTPVTAMHWNFGTFCYSCFMLAGIYSSHCNALELWNLLVLMFYAGRYILQSLQCIGTLEPSATHVLCWQVYTLVTAMHWNFGTFWYSCFMLAGIYSSHCNALELWNLLLLMFYAGRYILQSLQCIGTLEPSATHVLCWQVYTLVPAMHWNFGTFWHSCFMLAGIYSSHCNALELWNLLLLMFYAGRYILQSLQCIGTLEPSGTHVLCWQVYTPVTAMHWNFGTFCYSWFILAGIYSSHCNALELWNLLVLMFYAGRYIL